MHTMRIWYNCSDRFGEWRFYATPEGFFEGAREAWPDEDFDFTWQTDGDAEWYVENGERVLRQITINRDGNLVQVEDGQIVLGRDEEAMLSELAIVVGLQHDQLRRAVGDGRLSAHKHPALRGHGPWLSSIDAVLNALEAGHLLRRRGRPRLQ